MDSGLCIKIVIKQSSVTYYKVGSRIVTLTVPLDAMSALGAESKRKQIYCQSESLSPSSSIVIESAIQRDKKQKTNESLDLFFPGVLSQFILKYLEITLNTVSIVRFESRELRDAVAVGKNHFFVIVERTCSETKTKSNWIGVRDFSGKTIVEMEFESDFLLLPQSTEQRDCVILFRWPSSHVYADCFGFDLESGTCWLRSIIWHKQYTLMGRCRWNANENIWCVPLLGAQDRLHGFTDPGLDLVEKCETFILTEKATPKNSEQAARLDWIHLDKDQGCILAHNQSLVHFMGNNERRRVHLPLEVGESVSCAMSGNRKFIIVVAQLCEPESLTLWGLVYDLSLNLYEKFLVCHSNDDNQFKRTQKINIDALPGTSDEFLLKTWDGVVKLKLVGGF